MKKNKSAFHKNMETMTKKRIEAMQVLDSENTMLLLFDNATKKYVVFDQETNATHFANSYQQAEKFYNHQIILKNN